MTITFTPEDLEDRKNAYALHVAWRAAARATPGRWEPNAERDAEMEQLDEEYERRKNEIYAKYAPSQTAELAVQQAEQAYRDAPGDALMEDYQNNAVLCAATGIPIWESDEIVEDNETGQVFLRAALGLPPRPADDEDEQEAA